MQPAIERNGRSRVRRAGRLTPESGGPATSGHGFSARRIVSGRLSGGFLSGCLCDEPQGATMSLLVAYIICLVLGQSITISIGLVLDRVISPGVSLPISIALYFAMFWMAWKVAVKITEPKTPPQSTVAPPPQS